MKIKKRKNGKSRIAVFSLGSVLELASGPCPLILPYISLYWDDESS